MIRFSVGEQVIVRFGKQQGQKARIMESQPANVYKVKMENGAVLFFDWKGLQKENDEAQQAVRLKG